MEFARWYANSITLRCSFILIATKRLSTAPACHVFFIFHNPFEKTRYAIMSRFASIGKGIVVQHIKKYANRKLYHTNRKQYITLEGIAQLVQAGDSVQVLDNETGDDITASTLAQVVLLAKRSGGGLLPTNVLTGLIQTGGDTIASLRRAVVTSLGGIDLVELEIVRRIDSLLSHGFISAEEASRMRHLLLNAAATASESGSPPMRSDVDRLKTQLDDLSRTVEQFVQARKSSDTDAGG